MTTQPETPAAGRLSEERENIFRDTTSRGLRLSPEQAKELLAEIADLRADLTAANEALKTLGFMYNQAKTDLASVTRERKHSKEFWHTRETALRQWAQKIGNWDVVACILANGREPIALAESDTAAEPKAEGGE